LAYGLGEIVGRVAVVTGAASGIGRATARLLGRRGARLVLCDVDGPKLQMMARELSDEGAVVAVFTVDVARCAEVERFAKAAIEAAGVPDLVVNAAGVLVLGPFVQTTADDWNHVIDVNLKGPANVCRAFLPAMVGRGVGGYIVNVASAAAFATQSELCAYGATKHALFGLSQGLADELAPARVGVSVVCPGFVDTPILERARVRGDDPEATRLAARAFLRKRRLTPERVAERIVTAAERGIAVVPVGIEARALWWLSRLTPTYIQTAFGLVRRLGPRT
jgi:NAD(P)-dependent dehydrogenase (short-subunit alcohol dehydrogenase family)